MAHILGTLAYGKEAAKAEDRGGGIVWDLTLETFQMNDISCNIEAFKGFIHNIVGSMRELIYEELMFGMARPNIDLDMLRDTMKNERPGSSLLDEPVNRLENGYKFMLGLVKSARLHKRLIDENEEWVRERVSRYFNEKKRFLELLMLAFLLIGGQPVRGPELRSIKFRNSIHSFRNLFIINGDACFYYWSSQE